MTDTMTTIAQMLYAKRPPMNFAHIVRELDTALQRCPADRRSLAWDCDDVAIFDLDASRIVLGYSDDLPGQHRACLTVTVGHGPQPTFTTPLMRRRTSLCRLIIERISARYPADEVVWQDLDMVGSAEAIDRLLDRLPATEVPVAPAVEVDRLVARMDVELKARQPEPDTELLIEAPRELVGAEMPGFWSALLETDLAQRAFAKTRQKSEARAEAARTVVEPELAAPSAEIAAAKAPAGPETIDALVANDRPDLPRPMAEELIRLRAALYPEDLEPAVEQAEPPTTAMRLAVHAMNATLITVYAPVGAAVMTYSILKGEDMRLSGRMMALAGAFLALSHTTGIAPGFLLGA